MGLWSGPNRRPDRLKKYQPAGRQKGEKKTDTFRRYMYLPRYLEVGNGRCWVSLSAYTYLTPPLGLIHHTQWALRVGVTREKGV